jgi:hypothetical protein
VTKVDLTGIGDLHQPSRMLLLLLLPLPLLLYQRYYVGCRPP